LDPRFTGSNPAEDDGFSKRYKSVAPLPSEEQPFVVRFYGILKILAEYDRYFG
jgi:hypothetical protein